MTNLYRGTCEHCGKTVHAGEGLVRKVGLLWIVSHRKCHELAELKAGGASVVAVAKASVDWDRDEALADLYDGR